MPAPPLENSLALKRRKKEEEKERK